jgi:hypothetical protein
VNIEESRDSTVENEQVIAWYRLTGRGIRIATDAPLEHHVSPNPGRSYPTDAGSSNKPYKLLIDELGERRTDWGLD